MNIGYVQSADVYCMHSNDLLVGFHELGHRIFSNVLNYSFLESYGDEDIHCMFVSTTGNLYSFDSPDYEYFFFIDGRDSAEVEWDMYERSTLYFKTNLMDEGSKFRFLPSCTSNEQSKLVADRPRTNRLVFLSGHNFFGRDKVYEWMEKHPQYMHGFKRGDALPLNSNYPTQSCNTFSPEYYDTLNRSLMAINAPGEGVNTKKFFEIIAAGCFCLNYAPRLYRQKKSNILDIIPKELSFPRDCVFTFSDFSELDDFLAHESEDEISRKAKVTQEWAMKWTQKAKAVYVLTEIFNAAYKGK